jgi:hypothetical protein
MSKWVQVEKTFLGGNLNSVLWIFSYKSKPTKLQITQFEIVANTPMKMEKNNISIGTPFEKNKN